MVAHSGPVTRGGFVRTLVVADIATGWTECAPVLYRERTLLREVLGEVRRLMPFELLGFDTDNDSAFINETLRDYCRDAGIVFARCRPWRKNDQAFVEQKNGAVVRRIVGYRRPEDLEAAAARSVPDMGLAGSPRCPSRLPGKRVQPYRDFRTWVPHKDGKCYSFRRVSPRPRARITSVFRSCSSGSSRGGPTSRGSLSLVNRFQQPVAT